MTFGTGRRGRIPTAAHADDDSSAEDAGDRDSSGKSQVRPRDDLAITEPPLRKLTDILRALPDSELRALISRMGIRIDAAKRIDPPSQVARVLVGLPDVRDPSRL